nr:MAG TPA: hypothetical protein [Caudoviricetes sp.]
MILVKILLILIASGLLVGLTGTVICFTIDSLTNIDADGAMMVFFTIAIISFTLFAALGISAVIFSIWTNM